MGEDAKWMDGCEVEMRKANKNGTCTNEDAQAGGGGLRRMDALNVTQTVQSTTVM
jgi:hypothetical protein